MIAMRRWWLNAVFFKPGYPPAMACVREPCDTSVGEKPRPRLPAAPLILGALLIVELLVLTLRFDAASFARQNQWWGILLHESPHFLRVGISIAAVLVLISGRGWHAVVMPRTEAEQLHQLWAWVAVHLVFFGAFYALSVLLFEGVGADDPWLLSISVSWWLLGAVTLATWALALRPMTFWLSLLRHGKNLLITGVVVGILAYLVGNWMTRLWEPFSAWTFASVNFLLNCFLRDYSIEPSNFVIRTPVFAIQIAPQCSGYEGVGLVAVFMLTYLWLFRRHLRFPQALLLMPLAVVVVWVLNVVRIATLVILGDAGLSQLALQGFHSEAGWLAFNAVALGFAVVAEHSPWLQVRHAQVPNGQGAAVGSVWRSATTVHLLPFLAMLTAGMVARACGADRMSITAARVAAAVIMLWCFRRSYWKFEWAWSWRALGLGAITAVGWCVAVPWLCHAAAAEPAASPLGTASWRATGFLFELLSFTAITPVVEELAFRRYLARRIVAVDFERVDGRHLPWMAVALSSVLFGLLHGAYWLPATGAGVLFALAYCSRGRVGDAVMAHATTNALIASYVAITGQWFLWS